MQGKKSIYSVEEVIQYEKSLKNGFLMLESSTNILKCVGPVQGRMITCSSCNGWKPLLFKSEFGSSSMIGVVSLPPGEKLDIHACKCVRETSDPIPVADGVRYGQATPMAARANDYQVGGSHYKTPIEHWDYVLANDIPYLEAQVIKYLTRWRKKDGANDVRKAYHFLLKVAEAAEINLSPPTAEGGTEPGQGYTNQDKDC